MGREDIVHTLREIVAENTIFERVILFGSVARDENTAESDLDIYIEAAKELTTCKVMRKAEFKHIQDLIYKSTDFKDYDIIVCGGTRDIGNMKKSKLYAEIIKEGIVVYDRKRAQA